ncbi:MAG TPA: hypothetical protein VF323_13100 [Candidatus Limnocylindrales bacterium]
MRLRHLVALGSLAVSLAACGATATLAPGGGAQATAPTAVPSSGGSPAAGSGSPAAGGGGDAGDVSNLANATTKQMCTLLTTDEAKTIIGKPISIAPNGMAIKGLGTNCIYQTDDTMGDATFIKVEIGGISYKADVSLLGIGGGAASTTTVGGLDATAIDVTGTVKEAALVVRLTDAAKPPSLLIQAPTVDMAKAVAELVIPRLAALK